MIDTVIYSLIKNISEVQTHIDDRIYPGVIPENCKQPAIRYVVSDQPDELTGEGSTDYYKASLQLDIYHNQYSIARNIARAVQKRFHGYQQTDADIPISLIEHIDTDMLYENKSREHRALMTFTIQYKET